MTEVTTLTNHLLIAMPQLADPNFSQTVTYLCEHNAQGALGITINRPLNLTVEQMLQEINVPVSDHRLVGQYVYLGGPVRPHQGFVLHSPTGCWDATMLINDQVALTTSRDILEAIAKGEGPKDHLIALGYAGWGEGQLEREILDNAWLNTEADNNILFRAPAHERWHLAAGKLGIRLSQLSPDAGHA